jgi:uncharacterized membrane protein YfcA
VVAGAINTLAGGGSFLTVPLLVLVGLPPTVANATNRVGVLVQSVTAVAGFRQEGVSEVRLGLRLLPATLVGSWVGAWVAAGLSEEVFGRAFGALMLLALPLILRNPRPGTGEARPARAAWIELPLYFALGLYGGAFQAGIGIPLLLALVGFSGLDLVRAASARVFITAALTAVALAEFVRADKVLWVHGLVLALGTGAGGYVAARLGARLGPRLIRPVLALAVIALALRMLLGPV